MNKMAALAKYHDRRAAFAYCERIARQHSEAFHTAISRMPAIHAGCCCALYALDATIRTADAGTVARLTQEAQAFLRRQPASGPIWQALDAAYALFDLPAAPLLDMLHGRQARYDRQPPTPADLEADCRLAVEPLGELMLHIITDAPDALRAPFLGVCAAMRLTRLLCENGRHAAGACRAGIVDDAFIALWEKAARRAECLYDAFEAAAHCLREDSYLATLALARLSRGALDAVRSSGYRRLDGRARVDARQWRDILDGVRHTRRESPAEGTPSQATIYLHIQNIQ